MKRISRVDRFISVPPSPSIGQNLPGVRKLSPMSARKLVIVLLHAVIGWALCAATIGVGMAVTTVQNALVIHAVGAPVYFSAVSTVYYRRFNHTGPALTAVIFTAFVMVVDFFVMALLIIRSLAMFTSLLGTWIPFGLIFSSTFLTGLLLSRKPAA